jgi:hypothetical protein
MEANLFKGTEEPATSADIEAIEQEYGFTLPDDYKAHLLTHNGGWPTRTTFLQPEPDEPGEFIAREVSEFASVGAGENTLEDNLEQFSGECGKSCSLGDASLFDRFMRTGSSRSCQW